MTGQKFCPLQNDFDLFSFLFFAGGEVESWSILINRIDELLYTEGRKRSMRVGQKKIARTEVRHERIEFNRSNIESTDCSQSSRLV